MLRHTFRAMTQFATRKRSQFQRACATRSRLRIGFFAVLVAFTLAACGGSSTATPGPAPSSEPHFPSNTADGIQHVVIIIQENRTFDNLFHDYPGADSADSGTMHDGTKVTLTAQPLETSFDLSHLFLTAINDYDGGKMDGFDREAGAPTPTTPYAYVPQSEIEPYWFLAKNYALGDRMFASQLDASFSAHQYLIAGKTGGIDIPTATPWGCDAPPGTTVPTLLADRSRGLPVFPCFSYPTLGQELDARGVAWRFYSPSIQSGDVGGIAWLGYDANAPIRYGSDWKTDIVSPETKVLSDVRAGSLAAVTWVIPDRANSDHSGSGSKTGPDWVASVVNAVGTSGYWKDSVVLIVWDDWGGWYDHVPPPQLDANGLGFRVPLLVISPFAKRGYVSHVQYEFGSILRFVESRFGLAPLAASDARANDLSDCFDFGQQPAPFEVVPTHAQIDDFLRERPSLAAPDDQ